MEQQYAPVNQAEPDNFPLHPVRQRRLSRSEQQERDLDELLGPAATHDPGLGGYGGNGVGLGRKGSGSSRVDMDPAIAGGGVQRSAGSSSAAVGGGLKKSTGPQSSRFEHLDGLRGIACLIVVTHHWNNVFQIEKNSYFSDWGETNPLLLLYNGPFNVRIFFVLSGFVLAAPLFNAHARTFGVSGEIRGEMYDSLLRRYARMALARVFRLGFPVTIAAFIAWYQHHCGILLYNPDNVNAQLEKKEMKDWGKTLSFTDFFVVYVYKIWTRDGFKVPICNPLWTIQVEFRATFVVLATTLVLCCVRRCHWAVYLGLIFLQSWDYYLYIPFTTGILLAQLNLNGVLKRWRAFLVNRGGTLGQALCCVYFVLVLYQNESVSTERAKSIVHAYSLPFEHWHFQQYCLYVLSFSMVLLVLICPMLSSFFQRRPILFLGKISFSVYLLHQELLGSIYKPMVGHMHASTGLSWCQVEWLCLPPFIVILLFLAWAFTEIVEKRSPVYANKIALYLLG
eukprot:Nk52_evm19s1916 gene=Nk52_evmTU19s1916